MRSQANANARLRRVVLVGCGCGASIAASAGCGSAASEAHLEAVARLTASEQLACREPYGGREMRVTKIAAGAYRVETCGAPAYVRCSVHGSSTRSIQKYTCCHHVADEREAIDPPLISLRPDDRCVAFAGQ